MPTRASALGMAPARTSTAIGTAAPRAVIGAIRLIVPTDIAR